MFKPMYRRVKSDDGMTLLELVIAALILTFAVSALFGLLLTATNMSVQSKEQNLAVGAANSYLEMARSLSYANLGVLGGAGGSIDGTLPVRTVLVNGSFTVTITPSVHWIDDPQIVGAQNYKEVRVVVEVGAPPRTPITRTFATFVRAPGEILAITGGTGGAEGADPVLEWIEGQTPTAGAIVRGNSVYVTVRVKSPNVGGTIKRVQMFCGVPVLVGHGGGIASNGYTSGSIWPNPTGTPTSSSGTPLR
jgi:type II secretory pathway pseudopilin PulG